MKSSYSLESIVCFVHFSAQLLISPLDADIFPEVISSIFNVKLGRLYSALLGDIECVMMKACFMYIID